MLPVGTILQLALGCSAARSSSPAAAPDHAPGALASVAESASSSSANRGTAKPGKPTWRLELHWNDASDTTTVLRVAPNQRIRATVTVTGVDTLEGFRVTFRLHGVGGKGSTAWTFAEHPPCGEATWAGTAQADRKARAPWPRKFLITDAAPMDDGTQMLLVSATFDRALIDPDSTYSLCHLDFDPPTPVDSSATCAGWDGPARLYIEEGKLFRRGVDEYVSLLGRALRVEPLAAPTNSSPRSSDKAEK